MSPKITLELMHAGIDGAVELLMESCIKNPINNKPKLYIADRNRGVLGYITTDNKEGRIHVEDIEYEYQLALHACPRFHEVKQLHLTYCQQQRELIGNSLPDEAHRASEELQEKIDNSIVFENPSNSQFKSKLMIKLNSLVLAAQVDEHSETMVTSHEQNL